MTEIAHAEALAPRAGAVPDRRRRGLRPRAEGAAEGPRGTELPGRRRGDHVSELYDLPESAEFERSRNARRRDHGGRGGPQAFGRPWLHFVRAHRRRLPAAAARYHRSTDASAQPTEIGRASCRERVCQYV